MRKRRAQKKKSQVQKGGKQMEKNHNKSGSLLGKREASLIRLVYKVVIIAPLPYIPAHMRRGHCIVYLSACEAEELGQRVQLSYVYSI